MNTDTASIQNLVCSEELQGMRVDRFLSQATGLTRSRIQQLLKAGHIQSNGKKLKASASTHAQQGFRLSLPKAEPLDLLAEDIPLDILWEDEHLLVLNKAAGMVVHPGAGHATGTLVHALLHHCPKLPGINGCMRPGIVHRLDKDTSGSMVIAKDEASHVQLSAMFARHDLDREYLAWCKGEQQWQQCRIDLPLARHPVHRKKMSVREDGRQAITDARLEIQAFGISQMRLRLHTGRTHQIRVHLSHHRMPILHDLVYGRSYKPSKNMPVQLYKAIEQLQRQALHAELLAFKHPITGEALHFQAPLPHDVLQLQQALNAIHG